MNNCFDDNTNDYREERNNTKRLYRFMKTRIEADDIAWVAHYMQNGSYYEVDEEHNSALHWACMYGAIRCIRYFVACGNYDINEISELSTPLNYFLINNPDATPESLQTFAFLLDHGADPFIADPYEHENAIDIIMEHLPEEHRQQYIRILDRYCEWTPADARRH